MGGEIRGTTPMGAGLESGVETWRGRTEGHGETPGSQSGDKETPLGQSRDTERASGQLRDTERSLGQPRDTEWGHKGFPGTQRDPRIAPGHRGTPGTAAAAEWGHRNAMVIHLQ